MRLLPDQVELLREIVDVELRAGLPRGGQFVAADSHDGTHILFHRARGAVRTETSHLEELAGQGLIRMRQTKPYSYVGHVTADGYAYLERLEGTVQHVEQQIRRHLDDGAFRRRHPEAMRWWEQAALELGNGDPAVIRRIGSDLREALQVFATSLVESSAPIDADPDTAHTRNRVRSALSRSGIGDTSRNALLALWDAVDHSVQQATHAGQKAGTTLTIEDARRTVFLAMVTMFELDRAMGS